MELQKCRGIEYQMRMRMDLCTSSSLVVWGPQNGCIHIPDLFYLLFFLFSKIFWLVVNNPPLSLLLSVTNLTCLLQVGSCLLSAVFYREAMDMLTQHGGVLLIYGELKLQEPKILHY
jgi:hypothetical protein